MVAAAAAADAYSKIVATLIRVTGDWTLAEDCAQEALATALERWPRDGVPDNPAGWLVRTALVDRLGAAPGDEVHYRLEVELDDNITGFGIRRDDAVTRERRTLRARYRLVDARAGTVLLDATAGADAGVDVVSSEYATLAAEETALEHLSTEIADQIVSRLGLYASRGGQRPARPASR